MTQREGTKIIAATQDYIKQSVGLVYSLDIYNVFMSKVGVV